MNILKISLFGALLFSGLIKAENTDLDQEARGQESQKAEEAKLFDYGDFSECAGALGTCPGDPEIFGGIGDDIKMIAEDYEEQVVQK